MTFIIRYSSNIQLWCLLQPNVLTKPLLMLLYSVEVIMFSVQGARTFLTKRADVLGPNFAALGRLIVGEYNLTAELVKNPQRLGNFLGPARLLKKRLPPDFLLFLSDQEAGGTDRHKLLHEFIWNSLIIQAQDRLSSPDLQALIDELVESIKDMGNPPTAKAITPHVQTMVISYMMLVLLDVKINDEQVEAIRKLFYTGGPTSSYVLSTLVPLAPPGFLLNKLHLNIDDITLLIQNSPALKDYTPSSANAHLSKQQWSELLLAMIGIAALLGGGDLSTYVLSKIPADYPIDTLDREAVHRAVLETARLHAPVNIVNVIIPEPLDVVVAGQQKTLPQGTEVGACIGLAGLDPNQFSDPDTFNPNRDNLVTSMMNFNSIGFDAISDTGRRTCPGRNIAVSMCADLLIAWRQAAS